MQRLTQQASPFDNRQFMAVLARALLVLLISGVLLLVGLITLTSQPDENPGTTPRQHISRGSDFQVVIGGASRDSSLLKINRLDGERALLSHRVSLNSADYPFLNYELTGKHPGLQFYLFWRSSLAPERLSNFPLLAPGDDVGTVNLANHEAWKGQILELGIFVYGDLRGQEVEVHHLSLLSRSPWTSIHALWSDWTTFSSWRLKSINHLVGTSTHSDFPPTIVALLWAALSLLLLFAHSVISKQPYSLISYVTVILIPWLLLDGLWQYRLSQQLAETNFLFAKKSQHEKHLSDADKSFYLYAQELKQHLLPKNSARVFLLHNSEGHNYDRLKTQFYLLPNNVFNTGRVPRAQTVRANDYILVLGQNPFISYSESHGRLKWDNGSGLSAERAFSHPMGELYKVTEIRPSSSPDTANPTGKAND